jgi:hypothetical protein
MTGGRSREWIFSERGRGFSAESEVEIANEMKIPNNSLVVLNVFSRVCRFLVLTAEHFRGYTETAATPLFYLFLDFVKQQSFGNFQVWDPPSQNIDLKDGRMRYNAFCGF